ncbi:uncharacterized protein BJX67DRAFT_340344 [Aspergillus lucknowensis]|uniref:Mus7/MMS22 family-domain-containing protein n=1 Tax=Aspergillus lucknowensis TaxID=176173 RepID=A0ABR4M880_9EURO
MQMESWRERGFVPDSDDEDGFESQEKRVNRGGYEDDGITAESAATAGRADVQPVESLDELRTTSDDELGFLQEVRDAVDNEEIDLPLPSGRPKAVDDSENGTERELGKPVGEDRRPVHNGETPRPRSPEGSSTADENDLPSTPKPKQQRDIWDIPSSSPDLLQLDHRHRPWQASPTPTHTPRSKLESNLWPPVGNVESSPLSSPLTSLHSSALETSSQQDMERQPDQPLEDLLPPLDIPEDILKELDPPARRSLRQRNPIQLHPYLLEDARYQHLMKARGIKPVRVTHYEPQPRPAEESQGQDFVDDAGSTSDSQMVEFRFPPSSRVDPRQLLDITPRTSAGKGNRQSPQKLNRPRNSAGPRSPKRRRVAGPEDHHLRQRLDSARPQVVIQNPPESSVPDAPSFFDIPSPPRSGSVSSPSTQRNTGFRFPRGFSPPIITSRTETRKGTKDVDDMNNDADESDDVVEHDSDARSIRSAVPHSASSSDAEEDKIEELEEREEHEDDFDEAAVRRLQRRIRGVLPASWLRLDQQKQKERLSATQRNRDRISRMETEAAKGVARKITRKADSSAPSSARGHLSSLRQLADDDSQESGKESDDSDDIGSRQRLADLFGFEDSLLTQDPGSDIPEDNRIDDMFPSASRNRTPSEGRKIVKKRRRTDTDQTRNGGQPKKPRLKRQARLTDPVYGGRKTKRPSRRLPKLGILDAPDFVSRPRNEQPQFLRVAARKARSRQDRGRRSPSRKVIRLSSRVDTEDANASLRDWHAGRLRQTTLPRIPSQVLRRRPLMNLSTNAGKVSSDSNPKRTGVRNGDTRHTSLVGAGRGATEHASTLDAPLDTEPKARDTATTKVVHQRRGNAWVIQRNLAISSLSRNNPRPVVPGVENHNATARTPASLQGSLALLNRDGNLLLNRFLARSAVPRGSPPPVVSLDKPKHSPPKQIASSRRREVKKRPPKRLEVAAIDSHAPPMFLSPERESSEPLHPGPVRHSRTTGGLANFRTTYPVDFAITPLQPGVFFHESTFIGSGDFSRSLDIAKRDLDGSTGFFYISLGDQSMRWGAWDDNVSSQLGMAFDKILGIADIDKTGGGSDGPIRDGLDSRCAILRSLVKYVTGALTFVDPIDRVVFVTRANSLISKLMEDLANVISATGCDAEQLVRIASYGTVFANQVCQIASHNLVNQSVRDETFHLLKSVSKRVIFLLSDSVGQKGIQEFLAAGKLCQWREAGIKDDHPIVEAYVIVQHVLRSADRFQGCLEEFVAEAYSSRDPESTSEEDITALESAWQKVFTTLPLQEIDAVGIVHVGSRFKGGHDNWTLVKRLLRPVLDSDEANSESQPISYYSYCRVLFHRCFILINGWGWRDCKPILDTLYDFFAKRTLYSLRLEESYKSPSFLDELDGNPSFEVLPGDSCFHILLKIIASGLRFLSKIYDKKKIRNYTWRLLPNHGREYPKEQSIRQADLDALRNHHDLICTLYSSVPEDSRPQLKTIKNLVHPASSHRETCKISLRSWTRLARFKLSTNEDASGLVPLAEWHGYFVTEFLKQHSLARREIEAQNEGGRQFSQQLIDRTISQNQWQIESLLKTALQGLQSAIKSAHTAEHAQKIVSETPINSVLGLFNVQVHRLNATVLEALQVIVMYVQRCNLIASGASATKVGAAPAIVDEDSQDYGDWTDLEAAYAYEFAPITPGVEHVEKVFRPAVSRLLSNCFGEDRYPDDAVLMSVVDCWTAIAHTLVKHGLRRWDSYVGPYESDSWVALRRTIQTRKYTPQFLAQCIEKDGQFVSECKMHIFGMWLSSLVERVSMLKFQHRLTEALLNRDATDPVLKNLPFSRDPKEGRYLITFLELSQRRLSLLSSLLSNMRTHVQELDDANRQELSTTRQEYRELLQTMMSSMKANYQELGNGEEKIRGAYVEFVQSVVGFLQQHTRDICPIDPFFTDTGSFPLPSTDPTYIVARLKSYEPKLSSPKVAKTLVVFIQSVSERAALDGEQKYLVNQLYDSMKETCETGNSEQPTLRATLLQCVFPAYFATSFNNPAAWILSRPIIETTTRVFQQLLFNIDAADSNCVESVLKIFIATFGSSYNALRLMIDDVNMLKEAAILITAAAFLEMVTSALPILDYIDRLATDTASTRPLIDQVRALQQFALFIISHLQNRPQQTQPHHDTPLPQPAVTPSTNDIRLCATSELQSYLNESWSCHQNKYYFTRRGGHQPQEVKIEPPIAAKLEHFPERELIEAAMTFLDSLEGLDLFGESEDVDRCIVSDYVWGEEPATALDWANEELVFF